MPHSKYYQCTHRHRESMRQYTTAFDDKHRYQIFKTSVSEHVRSIKSSIACACECIIKVAPYIIHISDIHTIYISYIYIYIHMWIIPHLSFRSWSVLAPILITTITQCQHIFDKAHVVSALKPGDDRWLQFPVHCWSSTAPYVRGRQG